ncbi:MAG: hypothetical protein KBT46_00955, partial [Ruminococcus sp.]|nr:hypothetical protein [Candidatus Copronaster equi]
MDDEKRNFDDMNDFERFNNYSYSPEMQKTIKDKKDDDLFTQNGSVNIIDVTSMSETPHPLGRSIQNNFNSDDRYDSVDL